MKKQILILTFFVAALLAGTSAFGQIPAKPYQTVPEPSGTDHIECLTAKPLTNCGTSVDALHPIQGVPYTYTVATTVATDDVRWFVVNNNDLKTNSPVDSLVSMVTGILDAGHADIDPGNGTGDYILSVTDLATTYNQVPVNGDTDGGPASIEIEWKYFNGLLPNEVLLVAYVEGDDACTNNIAVYRIIPEPAFTIDIAVLNDLGDSIAPAQSNTAGECVSPIESAVYTGGATTPDQLLTVDYGENWIYFIVNGANYIDSWMPEFQLTYTGGDADPIAEVSWAYMADAESAAAGNWNSLTGTGVLSSTATTWTSNVPVIAGASYATLNASPATSAVGNGAVPAPGGECIVVRVRLDWGTTIEHDEGPSVLRFAANGIAYDGDNASGTFFDDRVNFEDLADDNCAVDSFDKDWVDYNITPRPQVEEGTPQQELKTGQGTN